MQQTAIAGFANCPEVDPRSTKGDSRRAVRERADRRSESQWPPFGFVRSSMSGCIPTSAIGNNDTCADGGAQLKGHPLPLGRSGKSANEKAGAFSVAFVQRHRYPVDGAWMHSARACDAGAYLGASAVRFVGPSLSSGAQAH